MKLADGSHLTYCSNIHAGETWPELRDALVAVVPEIKARVCPDAPFGMGLRISKSCLDALRTEAALTELRELLASRGLYVFTINGFPYGAFHGRRVKEEVYRPDWLTPERLDYTCGLADILVALLPDEEELEGSISTVPCGERIAIRGGEDRAAELLLRLIAHLAALRQATGRTVAVGLEPEPGCHLETTAELVTFFEEWLFSRRALARLAWMTGLAPGQAEEAVRRHAGMCLDLCHAAVQRENPKDACEAPLRAGIRIVKLQVTAGLVARGDVMRLRCAFEPLRDEVYLHQVTELGPAGRRAFLDLPEALIAAENAPGDREWRVHYHVPVFAKEFGALASTSDFAATVLAAQRHSALSQHLEVETYTWSVLPEPQRGGLVDVVARELAWVKEQLGHDSGGRA